VQSDGIVPVKRMEAAARRATCAASSGRFFKALRM